MAVSTTIRKHTATGDGSSGQAFTVPFTIDEESHLYVYEGSTLKTLTTNYTIAGEGVKLEGETQQIVVTWVGTTTGDATYTFIRITPRTQTEDGKTVSQGNMFERGLGKIAMQYQESMIATLEIFDADGSRIQSLAVPTDDADLANYLYAQARFSTTGYVPPPVSGIDNGKLLYANEVNKVVWKDPNAIPTISASAKLLQVDQTGAYGWVTAPTFAPSNPNIPSFLATNSGGSAIEWQDISDLPPTTGVDELSGITSQEGGTVAWEEVKTIPGLPANASAGTISTTAGTAWILTLWDVDQVAVESTTSVSIGKCTNIHKAKPTYNFGASNVAVLTASSGGNNRNLLFEVDVSSNNFDVSTIVKAELKIKIKNSENSTDDHTLCIGRMKQAWVEGSGNDTQSGDGATWNTYNGSDNWPGGSGALNDVDYDKHVYPAYVKGRGDSEWTAGTSKTFDITELLIDAIENRSGVLSLYMFSKTNASSTVWINWYSDDDTSSANRPTLEVTTASTVNRQAKWCAVAWGKVSIDMDDANWSTHAIGNGSAVNDFGHYGQGHMDYHLEKGITHNLGMNNLIGVAQCYQIQNDDVSHVHVILEPNDLDSVTPWNAAKLYVYWNKGMYSNATSSATSDGDCYVSYVIWSDNPLDSPTETSNCE